jgi:hypothetical protein
MDSDTHKCCEEILNLLIEKNMKNFEYDSMFSEFSALDESLDLLFKKANDLLDLKKSMIKISEGLRNSQKIKILPVEKGKNSGILMILMVLAFVVAIFAVLASDKEVVPRVFIR